MNSIEDLILDFNDNNLNHHLRDYYQTKSFLDRFNKGRDEESHSGFVAWLLSNTEFSGNAQDSPLMNFLELLVRNNKKFDTKLKHAILSRNISLSDIKVKCEKKVKELSNIKTEDEIDIFLDCNINGTSKYQRLQIFVENKILSHEEPPKTASFSVKKMNAAKALGGNIYQWLYEYFWQTNRYYLACAKDKQGNNKSNDLIQLFVYLCPEGGKDNEPHNKKYTIITYQNLLDYVILPLYNEGGMSESDKIFTAEYIKCLSLPTEDVKTTKRIVLALTNKERKELNDFCQNKNNYNLVVNCLYAIIKYKANKILDLNEHLLVDFFCNNRTLFEAAHLASKGSPFSKTAGDCIHYIDSKKVDPGYLIIKDGHVWSQTEIGLEFSKAFVDHFSKTGDTDLSLNQKVTKEMKPWTNRTIGIFGQSGNTYGYDKYKGFYIKTTGLWGGSRPGDAYSKLCQFLLVARPSYFTFDNIIKI